MAFLIGAANSAVDAAYSVANSCRFEDGDSPYMHKTCSTAFDTEKWTISIWFKRGNLGINTRLISCDNADGSDDDYIRFDTDDRIEFHIYGSGSSLGFLKTNRLFKDIGAWYHLVCVWDSANGTAGNRMRMYVNGTEETSFQTDTNPNADVNATWGNTSHPIEVGRRGTDDTQYFDGYIAEVAVCDGQAYAASDFGEFDEDSPTIWKPKDVSGLTFGTSGFYLDFEASANLGNDANGGTDFTEVNLAATDSATDTPTNNFATMNPLDNYFTNSTFSEGNTTVAMTNTNSNEAFNTSTIGASSGKWYFEGKWDAFTHSSDRPYFGVTHGVAQAVNDWPGGGSDQWFYRNDGAVYTGGSSPYTGSTLSVDDIVGVAMDLDNYKLYFSVNGTFQNSGDPTSGATGTGAVSLTSNETYFFALGDSGIYGGVTLSANFGNPAFSISSGNADANGYGNFEFAVPSGYFALCTKNLGAYGG